MSSSPLVGGTHLSTKGLVWTSRLTMACGHACAGKGMKRFTVRLLVRLLRTARQAPELVYNSWRDMLSHLRGGWCPVTTCSGHGPGPHSGGSGLGSSGATPRDATGGRSQRAPCPLGLVTAPFWPEVLLDVVPKQRLRLWIEWKFSYKLTVTIPHI